MAEALTIYNFPDGPMEMVHYMRVCMRECDLFYLFLTTFSSQNCLMLQKKNCLANITELQSKTNPIWRKLPKMMNNARRSVKVKIPNNFDFPKMMNNARRSVKVKIVG